MTQLEATIGVIFLECKKNHMEFMCHYAYTLEEHLYILFETGALSDCWKEVELVV